MDVKSTIYKLVEASNVTDIVAPKSEWLKTALLFQGMNFGYSSKGLVDILSRDDTKWYLITNNDSNLSYGVIGFRFIDFIQRSAELFYIIDSSVAFDKGLYLPLKILLERGIRDWNLKKINTYCFVDDKNTCVMLKGFGFKEVCVLKEHVIYKDNYYDVSIMTFSDRNLNIIEKI